MTHVFHRNPKQTMPVAVGGSGIELIDSNGRRYLDASGGAAVSCLGHGHPRVVEATGLAERAAAFEVDLDALMASAAAIRPAPRVGTQPLAKEDLAVIVEAGDCADAARDVGDKAPTAGLEIGKEGPEDEERAQRVDAHHVEEIRRPQAGKPAGVAEDGGIVDQEIDGLSGEFPGQGGDRCLVAHIEGPLAGIDRAAGGGDHLPAGRGIVLAQAGAEPRAAPVTRTVGFSACFVI